MSRGTKCAYGVERLSKLLKGKDTKTKWEGDSYFFSCLLPMLTKLCEETINRGTKLDFAFGRGQAGKFRKAAL